MRLLIQILALVGFVAAALSVNAAPRAAEDPSAVVISTNESAPRVKQKAPQQPKPAKTTTNKKVGGKAAKPAKKAK